MALLQLAQANYDTVMSGAPRFTRTHTQVVEFKRVVLLGFFTNEQNLYEDNTFRRRSDCARMACFHMTCALVHIASYDKSLCTTQRLNQSSIQCILVTSHQNQTDKQFVGDSTNNWMEIVS